MHHYNVTATKETGVVSLSSVYFFFARFVTDLPDAPPGTILLWGFCSPLLRSEFQVFPGEQKQKAMTKEGLVSECVCAPSSVPIVCSA